MERRYISDFGADLVEETVGRVLVVFQCCTGEVVGSSPHCVKKFSGSSKSSNVFLH